jgi:HEAT repeat protein
MLRPAIVSLFSVSLVLNASAGIANRPEDDEQILRNAGVTDGPKLLEFFRKRTPDRAKQEEIGRLIQQLGNPSFKIRGKASAELVTIGVAAMPALRQAAHSADLEVVRRAEDCLRLIDQRENAPGLMAAAIHVLAQQKPASLVEVLVAFLPFADSDAITEEVQSVLAIAALRDGKPDKTLLTALRDPLPLRRAAVAEILCRTALPQHQAEVRKLLRDDDLNVRLRVALALAAARDKEAVPVLIELLAELSPTPAWQAEDFLLRLANDQAPDLGLGSTDISRRQCRDAWRLWWQEHAATAEINERLHGYTLLVMLDEGRAIELDAQDKIRLQFDGLQFPLDAQMLSGDSLLVAEYRSNRVAERDRKGKIIWEKGVDKPLMAQRLRNGHTFIATREEMLEVDRSGRQVARFNLPAGEAIMKAQRLPNGDIACVTMQRFVRLDSSGKELKTFTVNISTSGGRIEVMPNGHVLVPEMYLNRVVEYDANGAPIRTMTFFQPVAAVRLPNGHTLLTSYRQTRAVEMDEEGQVTWSYDANLRVTRAFRR